MKTATTALLLLLTCSRAALAGDQSVPIILTDSTATPAPTTSPAPTLEPPCELSGPLVPCRARQDPAAILNQRLQQLEQQFVQFSQAVSKEFPALANRVAALEQGKPKKP